ncbi:MAG: FAD-dependent oxidoreductase [Acidobacteriota bacterium]
MDFDVAIIGSGFGGAVAALRAAQKGLRVVVMEQGRWITPTDMAQAAQHPSRLLWQPRLGLNGFFAQDFYRHMSLVRGIAVGGGSIVYAAVLLQPQQGFYDDPAWRHLPDRNWRQELAPHFQAAQTMLGPTDNPRQTQQDAWLLQTARRLGVAHRFGPMPQAIHFGDATGTGVVAADPYFNGAGPERASCTFCGNCTTGCAVGAKNSLDKNYLHLAQQRGVRIISEHRVEQIFPLDGGGYRLAFKPVGRRATGGVAGEQSLTAERVIVAGGVVGTLELLLACRDRYRTLPNLSAALGQHVRTNSETIAAVTHPGRVPGLRDGSTISTHFYLDDLHVHQNRFSPAHRILRWQVGDLVNDPLPWRRALKTAAGFALHPVRSTASMRAGRDWADRTTVLLAMRADDSQLAFRYGRSWAAAGRWCLQSTLPKGQARPLTYLPIAQQVVQTYAQVSGGTPGNTLLESLANLSVTAHVLGGAVMASSPAHGVIDERHEAFGHPGLFVMDASAIPANVGVNPSLTITAMAERAMSLF